MLRLALATSLTLIPSLGRAQEIRIVAAGSLTGPFSQMISEYFHAETQRVATVWGPSGVLRDRLEQGESFDVFASAALPMAEKLTTKGLAGPTVLFARNALYAVVPMSSPATTANLVEIMLDPATRIGTSTPKADPGGDYTWQLFEIIDNQRPGALAALSGKAQRLFGSATTTDPVNGRHRLGLALEGGIVDVVVYYCSGGQQIMTEAPGKFRMVQFPAELAVGPEYGITLSRHAPVEASQFAMYVLSGQGQKTLKEFGFIPVSLPHRQ